MIGMLSQISPKHKKKGRKNMRFIHATYNMLHNSIDVTTFDGYILQIDVCIVLCTVSGSMYFPFREKNHKLYYYRTFPIIFCR